MTPAGKRDRRIIFERYTATQADSGEEVQTWAQVGKSQKAKVYYGSGSERREASREFQLSCIGNDTSDPDPRQDHHGG